MAQVAFPVQEISDVDMAFGGRMSELMPPYADIPKEFKDGHTRWNEFVSDWFYCGLSSCDLKPQNGIDVNLALRHLKTIVGSFAPKHEHKEAAVAYLASLWFKPESTWTVKVRKDS